MPATRTAASCAPGPRSTSSTRPILRFKARQVLDSGFPGRRSGTHRGSGGLRLPPIFSFGVLANHQMPPLGSRPPLARRSEIVARVARPIVPGEGPVSTKQTPCVLLIRTRCRLPPMPLVVRAARDRVARSSILRYCQDNKVSRACARPATLAVRRRHAVFRCHPAGLRQVKNAWLDIGLRPTACSRSQGRASTNSGAFPSSAAVEHEGFLFARSYELADRLLDRRTWRRFRRRHCPEIRPHTHNPVGIEMGVAGGRGRAAGQASIFSIRKLTT